MTYGGLLLEYFFDPNKLINYSVSGLIGGGGVDFYSHRGRHHGGREASSRSSPGRRLRSTSRSTFGLTLAPAIASLAGTIRISTWVALP